MKSVIKLFFLAVTLTAFSGPVAAQSGKQRPTQEQLTEARARRIAGQIALDDKTTEQFTKAYCQYRQDLKALGKRPRLRSGQTSDEETERLLKARFAHSQKLLDLRQKYYGIYSKFLTQKQIKRVYELEKQPIGRWSNHHGMRHGMNHGHHARLSR